MLSHVGPKVEVVVDMSKLRIPKWLILLLRLGFGGGLLVFLLTKMDLKKIGLIFSQIDLYFFFLALASYIIATLFATFRWKTLLTDSGISIPLLKLFSIYLSALFLGNFLPSGGLDLVRGLAVSKISGKRASSFATVFLDRVLGFIAIFSFVVVGLFYGVEALAPYRVLVLVVLGGLVVSFLLIFSRHFRRFLDRWIHKIPLGSHFFHLYDELHRFRGQWVILLSALILSFGVQFFYVTTAYMDALSLIQRVPFSKMLFFVTAINFLAMIPITISGLGVREGAFILLFSNYMPQEAALSLSVLYYLTGVVVSLLGALFILFGGVEGIATKDTNDG